MVTVPCLKPMVKSGLPYPFRQYISHHCTQLTHPLLGRSNTPPWCTVPVHIYGYVQNGKKYLHCMNSAHACCVRKNLVYCVKKINKLPFFLFNLLTFRMWSHRNWKFLPRKGIYTKCEVIPANGRKEKYSVKKYIGLILYTNGELWHFPFIGYGNLLYLHK